MKRGLVILICFCCALSWLQNAEAQLGGAATAGVVAEAAGKIIDSPLVAQVFAWLTRERTPQEKAQPLIRALYAALLEAKAQRESLKESIEERMQLLRNGGSQDQLAANRDEIIQNTRQLGGALRKLRTAFDPLHVDLDVYNSQLANGIDAYLGVKGKTTGMLSSSNSATAGGIESGTWSLSRLRDLQIIDARLKANDRRISGAIAQLREQTRKMYPMFGELLPGASTRPVSSQ